MSNQVPFLPLETPSKSHSYADQLENHHRRVGLQFIDFSLVLGVSLPFDERTTTAGDHLALRSSDLIVHLGVAGSGNKGGGGSDLWLRARSNLQRGEVVQSIALAYERCTRHELETDQVSERTNEQTNERIPSAGGWEPASGAVAILLKPKLVHVRVNMCARACMCACMCIRAHACAFVRMRVHSCACVCMRAHVCVCGCG